MILFLAVFSAKGQNPADSIGPPRLLNIGLKAGPSPEFAQTTDNPIGLYASDHGLLELKSFNLAIDAQLFSVNGVGGALETGFRKNQGDFSSSKKSRLFQGKGYAGFSRSSIYLKPSFLYNKKLGEAWILMAFAGAEFHKNLDAGIQYLYDENYRYESVGYYSTLSGGLEVRTWLDKGFGLSFYANYLYGLSTTAEMYRLAEGESGDFIKLGEYSGSGLDLGFRVSYCLSCKN